MPRWRFIMQWLVVVALLGCSAATATAQTARSAASPIEQLEALMESAPARQVGQPGNDAVDEMVRRRFDAARDRHNDPQRWREAQEAVAAADAADASYAAARDTLNLVTAEESTTVAGFWARYLLEKPAPVIMSLLMVAGVFFLAARLQKRRALAIAGGVLVAVSVGVGITAKSVTTEAESAGSGSLALTGGDPQAGNVNAAATAAWAADVQAGEKLKGLWQSGRVVYPTAAFIPGKATLEINGERIRAFTLAPNLIEPANLPEEGFSGPLIYVGRGGPSDLSGKSLEGAAVLIEFDSARRWTDAVQLGARVVFVLEPPRDATFAEAAQKITESPLSIPRFYLRRDDLAEALGRDYMDALLAGTRVHVRQEPSRWEHRQVAADWLYIPAAGGKLQDPDADKQLVHFQAYKDSLSVVPELSPGAVGAGNLVLLMRMLDRFEQEPPSRPVLLSVVNDHTNALQGEQNFAHAAFADGNAVAVEYQTIETELAQQRFLRDVYTQPPSPQLLARMRDWTPDVGGQMLSVKEAVTSRLSEIRNTELAERNRAYVRLEEDKALDQPKLSPQVQAALTERIQQIEVNKKDLIAQLKLFNRYGATGTYEELTESQKAKLAANFAQVAEASARRVRQLELWRDRLTQNVSIRRALRHLTAPADEAAPKTSVEAMAQRFRPLPAAVAVTLDLGFGSDAMGFFYWDHLKTESNVQYLNEAKERINRLARYTVHLASRYSQETGQPNRFVDTIRMAGGVPWEAHLGGRVALGARPLHGYAVTGLTLTSVRDMKPQAFTPHDTVERINPEFFNGNIAFAEGYLARLVDAPDLGQTVIARGTRDSLGADITVRLLDENVAVGIPKTELIDTLVLAQIPSQTLSNNATMFGEVRPWAILLTDQRGAVTLRGGTWRDAMLHVFGYDADYRALNVASNFGDAQKRFSSGLSAPVGTTFITRTIIGMAMEKVDLIGLTEPLTLAPAAMVSVIDARQDSAPRNYASAGVKTGTINTPVAGDGTGSIFVEPHSRFKLRVGSGLVINATESNKQGGGYDSDVGTLSNLVFASARDMWLLTNDRLEVLQDKGVKNDTASAYNSEAKQKIEAALAAAEAGRNDRLMVNAEQARGLAFHAYTRGLSTINDLIKAVIVFLALVIPFCFFLTKLISPFTDLNRNLGMFAGVFVCMTLLLRVVHPAFEVARTPEVVILAFIIMGLAGFVASVLIGRFNTTMNQAVEEQLQAESVEAPQSRLAGVAFIVGVNNMRRRRIRTSLTCVTIILVTFTMLSVISVGQDIEPATVRVGPDPIYSGFLYTQPGLSAIDPVQLRRLRAHFEGKAAVVSRAWAERLGEYGEYLGYELKPQEPVPGAPVPLLTAKVLVGLEAAEDGFLRRMPLVAGRWLSSDSAPEALLTVDAAALIGISPENMQGRKLYISGREVELVGLLSDKEIEQMHDLAGVPLLPMLSQASQTRASGGGGGGGTLDVGSSASAPGTTVARTVDVAFVSIDFARSLGSAGYRTLSVKYDNVDVPPADAAGLAWAEANNLIQFQSARLFVGLRDKAPAIKGERMIDPGEYAIASSSSTEVGGILKIAIPIILAATIILNTMLGSVMERRREVAIYNAIGLNPGHVMTFFLAESMVFGLVGSVAGYLIGQTLSLVVARFIPDLNLNYSSLSVMVVIFLTIATVLLSTVYPAMMAARAAVPSGQRRWSLPQPEGDEIHVHFPFSYDADRVLGVCAYLRDFMRQNSEASTGKFLAKLGPVGRVPVAPNDTTPGASGTPAADDAAKAHERAYAMLFDIAPAPFDLGVNQAMEVYAYYDHRVKAHMLSVHLTRLSGERGNWVTVNQPFLEALRKRLLGWRSQKAATHEAFYREGEQLFADAPDLPVVDEKARASGLEGLAALNRERA